MATSGMQFDGRSATHRHVPECRWYTLVWYTVVGCVFPRAEGLNTQLGILCIQSGSISIHPSHHAVLPLLDQECINRGKL